MLEASESQVDIASLEAEFVKVAKEYSELNHISYKAWRELGVPTATLKQASIARS